MSSLDNTFRYLNSKILIMGAKESGKTTLVRDIYHDIQAVLDEVHVFSQIDLFDNSLSNVTSHYTDISNAIYEDFSRLEDFSIYCKHHHDAKKLVIIENILDTKQIKYLEELLFNGRFYNVTLIITIQHPFAMRPDLRHQFDYIFASFYDFIADQKKLHNHYFDCYQSFDQFISLLKSLDKYEFIGMKVQSSPYVIKHKPLVHNDLRFISTKIVDNQHAQGIKAKNVVNRIDNIINELNDIKKELMQ